MWGAAWCADRRRNFVAGECAMWSGWSGLRSAGVRRGCGERGAGGGRRPTGLHTAGFERVFECHRVRNKELISRARSLKLECHSYLISLIFRLFFCEVIAARFASLHALAKDATRQLWRRPLSAAFPSCSARATATRRSVQVHRSTSTSCRSHGARGFCKATSANSRTALQTLRWPLVDFKTDCNEPKRPHTRALP